jgi:hypothetical protein
MDTATYAAEAAIEADHWWYVGRRLLFSDIINALGLPKSADILDVGTSAGTNLRMLRGNPVLCRKRAWRGAARRYLRLALR